ncbi:MAG: DUF423 domain-containing protein [Myxococcales bacterium]|nr:DUF423 domain-containing protein [Myxococcales bacterium]
MSPRWGLVLSAVFAGIAVAAGAFGAHGLKDKLDAQSLNAFEVSVRYQMYHALGLGLLSLVGWLRPQVPVSGPLWLMLIGIVLFSGSLYGLTLTSWRWLGPITPLGGLLLVTSWLWFALAVARTQ